MSAGRRTPNPLAWPRRWRRRLGVLLVVLLVAGLLLPPGRSEAAVRTAVGMRGTVLGRTAWYGSYAVREHVVLCLDAEKVAPDERYAYRRGEPLAGTLGARVAYTAVTYGGTRDAVTAIAAKLVVHDLQGARYPNGELDVMRLQPGQLAGFGGRESQIVTRARQLMQDVTARYRTGPYRLTLATPPTLDEEHRAPVTVTLLDGRGRAMSGFRVTLTGGNTTVASATVTTDGRGQGRATFTARDPSEPVRVTASAVLPLPEPVVLVPSRPEDARRAQRVVVSGDTPVTRTTTTTTRTVAPPPDTTVRVTVRKAGDVTAYHPVDGAVFELRAETPDGERVAGPVTVTSGVASFPAVVTTGLGSLWLVEVTPPPGYAAADPVAVPLEGTPTVDVLDLGLPGTLRLVKLDAHTRRPVAGAVLRLRYDADADGDYETDLGRRTTTAQPLPVADLKPGRYRVTEEQPPPGYQLPAVATEDVLLPPGGTLTVTFEDVALTTVRFAKTVEGAPPAAGETLAGAVFVVADGSGREVGRCTTDASGRCELPPESLVTGERYCWTETVAPAGFLTAGGGCFVAGHPSRVTVVGVRERRTPVVAPPPARAVPSLPVTGTGAGELAGLGAALLASGATLLGVTRRPRYHPRHRAPAGRQRAPAASIRWTMSSRAGRA